MFPLMGAAGGALSLLNSLLQSTTAATKAGGTSSTSLAQSLTGSDSQQTQAVAGSGQGAPSLSSGTLATLIALQGQGAQGQGGVNGQGGLFSQLDADGDGTISKSDFKSALGKAGVDTSSADALFGKLDANGDGSISKSELGSARRGHHHGGGGGGQGGLSSLMNSTDFTGSSTQTSTNSDGSSSTTITYADGSTVTMTTPAAAQGQGGGSSGGNSNGTNQTNLLEQLIKLQSQLTAQKSGSGATSTIA